MDCQPIHAWAPYNHDRTDIQHNLLNGTRLTLKLTYTYGTFLMCYGLCSFLCNGITMWHSTIVHVRFGLPRRPEFFFFWPMRTCSKHNWTLEEVNIPPCSCTCVRWPYIDRLHEFMPSCNKVNRPITNTWRESNTHKSCILGLKMDMYTIYTSNIGVGYGSPTNETLSPYSVQTMCF